MLGDQITTTANLDIEQVFTDLLSTVTDTDFSSVTFDTSGLLSVVSTVAPPELAGVLTAVTSISSALGGAGLDGALTGVAAGAGVDDQLSGLLDLIGLLGAPLTLPDVDTGTGLLALSARVEAVSGVFDSGPIPALAGLVPGLDLAAAAPRLGGALGGAIALVQALAALAATSSATAQLEQRSHALAGLLDVEAATDAAANLTEICANVTAITQLQQLDANDPESVAQALAFVAGFQRAVLRMSDIWSTGMGFGEAALVAVDVPGSAFSLDVARLALHNADLDAVRTLATSIQGALAPLLEPALPNPAEFAGGALAAGLATLDDLRTTIEAWDATVVSAPIATAAGAVMAPLQTATQLIELVANEIAGAVRTVRTLIESVDLNAVAEAITAALAPVLAALAAIEEAVAAVEAELRDAAEAITDALDDIATAIEGVAADVNEALQFVHDLINGLGLATLAETLTSALTDLGNTLQAASLAPYFDTAVDVVDTTASVVDAVPFSVLPTDIQQEIVDACRPIKELELQPIEDSLRAELATIVDALQTDALDAIEEAYAGVVTAIASLDPEPALLEFEAGPMADLAAQIAQIDPGALLAPVEEALNQVRQALAELDLEAAILVPLEEAFAPVVAGLASLNPAELLQPVVAGLDEIRTAATELLHLDVADDGLNSLHDLAVAAVNRLDPHELAAAFTESVTSAVNDLPQGPSGGPLAGAIAALGRASGMDAGESGVAEALAWVGGDVDAALVVRARLTVVTDTLGATSASVLALDPAPVTAAAASTFRAITAAVQSHPSDSPLRELLDPLVSGPSPTALLGPLTENRRRYLAELTTANSTCIDLSASTRTEVGACVAGLRSSLEPLQVIPARITAILTALGLVDASGEPQTLSEILRGLLTDFGPGAILPAVANVVGALQGRALAVASAVLDPLHEVIATVRGLLEAVDITPIVDELTALHAEVVAIVESLNPRTLLADTVLAADEVITRVAEFDPLAPVRDVVDAAKEAIDRVLDSVRPTVVFAPAIDLHHEVLALAAGLDVRKLLEPVLAGLEGLAAQLDDGFDRSGDALQRLQAALPGEVSSNSASASLSLG